MSRARASYAYVAAAYLGMAGWAQAQAEEHSTKAYIPLSSTYADIAFSLASGSRQAVRCDEHTACQEAADGDGALRFSLQVQRIAGALQDGALQLYPDLARRVPGMIGGRFDVYVVEGDKPGSASSANGRIAIDAGLGDWQPYDDWMAFVIAREMGHVIARHHEENSTAGILTSIIMNILLPGSSLLKSALSAGASNVAAKSKHDVQALEADVIAFRLLPAAGFPLRDVALSLRVAPPLDDDDSWAKGFQSSADNLIAEAARTGIDVATAQ